MRIRIKRSILSSKKNINYTAKRKFKNKIKRMNKKHHYYIIPPKAPNFLSKSSSYVILFEKKISFPKNINEINNYIERISKASKNSSISIDHRKLEEIDNVSILLLTAGINRAFPNKKLYKNSKLSPKDKNINDRLIAIGYWDALCYNSNKKRNLNYLKITQKNNWSKIDNKLHKDIIDFFSNEHNIENEQKDYLFDAIYEAMANACEHAFAGLEKNEKNIWFFGSYNEYKEELEFVFYDEGIGIFDSIYSKKNRLFKLVSTLTRRYDKGKALRVLCTRDLSKYKNKKNGRGFGIIAFNNFIKNISRTRDAYLEVATDDKMYLTKDDRIIHLDAPIKGTLIRWVIGDKNEKENI